MLKNTNPSRANPASRTTALAVEKARSRKSRSDSMGWRRRPSAIPNAASSATRRRAGPRSRGSPSRAGCLDQPQDDGGQPQAAQQQARQVQGPGVRVAGLGHDPAGDHEGGHPHGQVHVEDPAPAEGVGEQPADDRAGGQGHGRHPRPQADGLDPLRGSGKAAVRMARELAAGRRPRPPEGRARRPVPAATGRARTAPRRR